MTKMALTGTFDDVSFAELLQMLNVGSKSGRLTVARPGESAVLFIVNGDVARAVSRRDRGPELVYKILGWKIGEFSFERSDDPVIRNIKESTEALILEGMKRFDEWERVEEELPDMHVVLRQRAFAVNDKFDDLSPAAQTVLRLVDAQRNVSTIIGESGLEPMEAVTAVTELLAEGIVEQWSGARLSGGVVAARGRLPEASGEIDISARAYFSPKERLTARPPAGAPAAPDQASDSG
jgi:hypothetical protein